MERSEKDEIIRELKKEMVAMEQRMDSKRKKAMDSMEQRMDSKRKEDRRFMMESMAERMEELDQNIKKYQRITDSRFDNFRAAQNLSVYYEQPRKRAYVEYGKSDGANYVSDDKIEPLPRYYR